MKMRLDKFLTHTGTATRTEAAKLIRRGRVQIDGIPATRADEKLDPEQQIVSLDGAPIPYQAYTYLMLNKPDGYISATDDPKQKTVLELLPPHLQKQGLFPAGRLDKDTLGLLILTNDGALAHRLLSPKHHAEKTYRFTSALPLTDPAVLERGITLDDGYHTLPCRIEMQAEREGTITLTEGKYHQIKRMLEAVGNRIVALERISFGGVALDEALPRGAFRPLTLDEIATLQAHP